MESASLIQDEVLDSDDQDRIQELARPLASTAFEALAQTIEPNDGVVPIPNMPPQPRPQGPGGPVGPYPQPPPAPPPRPR